MLHLQSQTLKKETHSQHMKKEEGSAKKIDFSVGKFTLKLNLDKIKSKIGLPEVKVAEDLGKLKSS